ncbi:hypothetical protein PVOR_28574 [Paenibacillus vortex V453]|uniref:Uncharacterized protein n=1 Tax=Paenibacillus vortex V453 TaxID=715225 RepID=A0A2R9SN57_9BACL|nr:hypothetical protein PVOR_28574 [Paenibacillus vortex V453]
MLNIFISTSQWEHSFVLYANIRSFINVNLLQTKNSSCEKQQAVPIPFITGIHFNSQTDEYIIY